MAMAAVAAEVGTVAAMVAVAAEVETVAAEAALAALAVISRMNGSPSSNFGRPEKSRQKRSSRFP